MRPAHTRLLRATVQNRKGMRGSKAAQRSAFLENGLCRELSLHDDGLTKPWPHTPPSPQPLPTSFLSKSRARQSVLVRAEGN